MILFEANKEPRPVFMPRVYPVDTSKWWSIFRFVYTGRAGANAPSFSISSFEVQGSVLLPPETRSERMDAAAEVDGAFDPWGIYEHADD
jgi:hypothetical protein